MNAKRTLLLVALLLVAVAAPVVGCPNCKDALAQEGAGGDAWARQADGFFWSILMMLGVLGTVAFFLIRMLVRAGADVAVIPPGGRSEGEKYEGAGSSRDTDRI